MIPFIYGAQDKSVATVAGILVNNGTIFTITGGPIQILELMSVCTVTNAGTASTIQYSTTPAVGTAKTISASSGTLTTADAGATLLLVPTTLNTAPTLVVSSAGGVQLGTPLSANHFIVLNGIITTVCGTILSTARWYHVLRYRPLHPDCQVV